MPIYLLYTHYIFYIFILRVIYVVKKQFSKNVRWVYVASDWKYLMIILDKI